MKEVRIFLTAICLLVAQVAISAEPDALCRMDVGASSYMVGLNKSKTVEFFSRYPLSRSSDHCFDRESCEMEIIYACKIGCILPEHISYLRDRWLCPACTIRRALVGLIIAG